MNRGREAAIYGAFVSILCIPAQPPICLFCATKEAASSEQRFVGAKDKQGTGEICVGPTKHISVYYGETGWMLNMPPTLCQDLERCPSGASACKSYSCHQAATHFLPHVLCLLNFYSIFSE